MKQRGKIKMHYLIAVLVIFFGINAGVTNAQGTLPTDYYVAPPPLGNDVNNGTTPLEPFATIQHAIDIAQAPETHHVTVHVASGTYYENIVMKDNVDLIGNSYQDTIIDGQRVLIVVKAANARIEKFTIRNGRNTCISCGEQFETPSSPVIVGNKIENCSYGVSAFVDYQEGPIYPVIENNIIMVGQGIYLSEQAFANGGANAYIVNNVIMGWNPLGSKGINLRMHKALPTIKNNIIMNTWGGIIFSYDTLLEQRKALVHNNDLWNNTHNGWCIELGIEVNLVGIQGNISENPLLVDPDGEDDILGTKDDDFHLTGNSPCIDTGMDDGAPLDDFDGEPRPFDGNGDETAIVDIGADEYVDSDDDGIPDNEDACPNSDLSETVVIDGCDSGVENVLLDDGCTISDLISQCADAAANHDEFVSCVSHTTNYLKTGEIIGSKDKGMIQKCAAKADIP